MKQFFPTFTIAEKRISNIEQGITNDEVKAIHRKTCHCDERSEEAILNTAIVIADKYPLFAEYKQDAHKGAISLLINSYSTSRSPLMELHLFY